MKKFLLPVLAFGMYVGTFAQIEVSDKTIINPDKWVITANNLKAVTSRLLLNNPAGSLWVIYVYRMADNKYILSYNQSTNKGLIVLPPGEYKITINNAPVLNVPIKKGHDTKLETGLLNVTDNDVWYLYDETGKTYVASGNKPEKLLMPARNYTLKIGGQASIVTVKKSNEENTENEERDIIDAAQYTLVPITQNQEISLSGYGRIKLYPPQENHPYETHTGLSIAPAGNSSTIFYCSSWIHWCPTDHTFPVGDYDIYISGVYVPQSGNLGRCPDNHSPLILKNIPIRNGYETRLKMGYLSLSSKGLCQFLDESKQTGYLCYLSASGIRWPVGKYWVKMFFVGEFQVEITNGKTTVLNPIDSAALIDPKWTIQLISKFENLKKGRLNTVFPEDDSTHHLTIQVPNPNNNLGYSIINLDSVKSIDLATGHYNVLLNYTPLLLPIEAGKETKIRYGYLYVSVPQGQSFQLYNAITGAMCGGYLNRRKVALPIGYYKFASNARSFLLKINEGETIVFNYNDFF